MFKVVAWSVPYKTSKKKRLFRSKKNVYITVKLWRIVFATTGSSYEWVGVFLEKRPKHASCGNMSLIVVPKNKEQDEGNMPCDLLIFWNLFS